MQHTIEIPEEKEKEFQKKILQLASICGWRTAHFRPAQTSSGHWVTPVSGQGKGFPDLVLVRDNVLIFAELKTDKGKLSEEQKDWIRDLERVSGIIVRVWRPSDWPEIEKLLM